MMSSLLFIAESQADPYLACITGTTSHPRYHDCENCEHVADKTCEDGVRKKTMKETEIALAEAREILNTWSKRHGSKLP